MADTGRPFSMRPFKFKGYEKELAKPGGWDETYSDKCVSLPVCAGDKCSISHWKPSFMERLKIVFGAGVWVFVANGGSGTQPPIALQAGFANRAKDKIQFP